MGTHIGASVLSASDAGDWVQAHAALSRLSRERAALDAEEGRWLLRAWRSAAHVHLGYGSFAQYVESLFGYKPRTTQEKLRVAEALEVLPRLAGALESGALSWCAARELTRVALPETEPAWLDAARGKTLRELEALVASRAPGDTPDAPVTERPRPRVLRFEVAAETFATFREAMQRLRHSAGASLDDDALLLAMARHVLGGPRDEGRSSYQISLSVCAVCGSGAQPAAGELVPVDAAVVAMATCDAQHLGELLPHAAASQRERYPGRSHKGPPGRCRTERRRARRDPSELRPRPRGRAHPRRASHRRHRLRRHAPAEARDRRRLPSEPARQTKHPARAASCRARARSTLLSRAGLCSRDIHRRAPSPAARRRRSQRGVEPPDTLCSSSSSRPSRRAAHRARARRSLHLPACGRHGLR